MFAAYYGYWRHNYNVHVRCLIVAGRPDHFQIENIDTAHDGKRKEKPSASRNINGMCMENNKESDGKAVRQVAN